MVKPAVIYSCHAWGNFLPEYVQRVSAVEDLYELERVFPRAELHNNHETVDFWKSRAILTPYNDSVVAINMELLLRFAGDNRLLFFRRHS